MRTSLSPHRVHGSAGASPSRGTALLAAALALIVPMRAEAHEVVVADSLEWLVADSDLVVRGRLTDVRPAPEGGVYGRATLAVRETLKGAETDEVTFAYPDYNWPEDPAALRDREIEVLVFLKNGQFRHGLRLDGDAERDRDVRLVGDGPFSRGAVTMDFRVLRDGEAILEAVRRAVEFGTGRPAPETHSLEVPFSSEAWQLLWGGSSVLLVVPVDERLEALARQWADLDPADLHTAELQRVGESTLQLFDSDDSAPERPPEARRPGRLRGSLLANGSFEVREGEPPRYIETLTRGNADLIGWEIVEGSIDWIGPERWTAADGPSCLDIDAPGAIRQTFGTTPGQTYLLQFDLAGNPETEPAEKALLVRIDDWEHTFSVDATGRSPRDMGWTTERAIFTATGETTTLTFVNASETATASGVALDAVAVHGVNVYRGSDEW